LSNKRSARLGFVAAIWLVLSVAVFGTLIGIAWMSMNATADVSADAFLTDSIEEDTTALDPIYECRDRDYWATPTDEASRSPRDKGYYPLPQSIGPGQNPGAFGFLLDSIGPGENPRAFGYLLDSIGPGENPGVIGHLRD
jgi:hypothetical protein